ncbi:MAG: GGDEF domain-containing protein [Thermodesulfobacteriota bacterium]|nr:GGDEF domain-containing protein [Thermodesulfobacteriota bacterium]
MSMKKENKQIRDLTGLAVKGLKQLADRGEQLTTESLYTVLSNMPEIEEVLGGDDSPATQAACDALQKDIDRLTRQKDRLLAELEAAEETAAAKESAFRRTMLFFAGFMEKTSEAALHDQSKKLSEVLRKQASPEVVEAVFAELKEMADQAAADATEKTGQKKKRAFSGFFKGVAGPAESVEKRYLEQFRETYRDIINTLGTELGEMFLERLAGIGERVQGARTINDFLGLRTEILSLFQDYIGWVASERETVTDFIKALGTKLISFEKILNTAFESTAEIYSANDAFAIELETKMGGVKDFLRSSRSLEELKQVLNDKLDSMHRVITVQREREVAIRQKMDRDIALIKSDFEKMKVEARKAKAKAEFLEQESLTDPLTGALNRRAFDKRIKEEIGRLIRYNRNFAMLIFDVDHFKQVNDTHGHGVGDQCLKIIVEKARPLLRDTDMLARYGGEEFVVILPETDRAGAAVVAEKLRATIEQAELRSHAATVRFTISIGVSTTRNTDRTPGDLFGRVDMALYAAKEEGRNRVVVK